LVVDVKIVYVVFEYCWFTGGMRGRIVVRIFGGLGIEFGGVLDLGEEAPGEHVE
jgi:hypothetical protein